MSNGPVSAPRRQRPRGLPPRYWHAYASSFTGRRNRRPRLIKTHPMSGGNVKCAHKAGSTREHSAASLGRARKPVFAARLGKRHAVLVLNMGPQPAESGRRVPTHRARVPAHRGRRRRLVRSCPVRPPPCGVGASCGLPGARTRRGFPRGHAPAWRAPRTRLGTYAARLGAGNLNSDPVRHPGSLLAVCQAFVAKRRDYLRHDPLARLFSSSGTLTVGASPVAVTSTTLCVSTHRASHSKRNAALVIAPALDLGGQVAVRVDVAVG